MQLRGALTVFHVALRDIFHSRRRVFSFVALAILTFLLFLWLPIKLTPGNDLLFQLSIMRGRDFFLFGLLSALNALLILMQWHLYRARQSVNEPPRPHGRGFGSPGGYISILVPALSSSPWCSMYFRICSSFTPTVLTKYPSDQKPM